MRYVTIAMALLFLGVILISGLSDAVAQRGPSGPTPVIVAPVARSDIFDRVEALGNLRANEQVDLTATVTERVQKILFEDSQTVTEGMVLVELEAEEEKAELAEEQAALAETQQQYERLKPLVESGTATETRLDAQLREVNVAQARVEAAQARVAQRVITAPFKGFLGLRGISVGALVQPGMVMTTITDTDVLKLDFSVPSLFMSSLEKGLKIEASSDAYPSRKFMGTVSALDNQVDSVTRTVVARALIDNQDGMLRPGMLMRVNLRKNMRQALMVPEEAVIPEGQKKFVMVVVDGQGDSAGQKIAEKREITIGASHHGDVEVLTGLNDGEQVVVHGTLRVRPNSPVTIKAVEDDNQTLDQMLTAE